MSSKYILVMYNKDGIQDNFPTNTIKDGIRKLRIVLHDCDFAYIKERKTDKILHYYKLFTIVEHCEITRFRGETHRKRLEEKTNDTND